MIPSKTATLNINHAGGGQTFNRMCGQTLKRKKTNTQSNIKTDIYFRAGKVADSAASGFILSIPGYIPTNL